MPSEREALFQLADGLHYIHSQNFAHRDIKPENILISASQPVRMIWSDFGLSKPTSMSGAYSLSEIRGTYNWIAPELIKYKEQELPTDSRPRIYIQSDIFSAGLIFFYLISGGKHPFGSLSNMTANIIDGEVVNMKGKCKIVSPFNKD